MPSGHLATILVSDDALRLVGIEHILDVTNFLGCLPLLAGVWIKVSDMMARLISMGVHADQATDIRRGVLS